MKTLPHGESSRRLITARLSLAGPSQPEVDAGKEVHRSQAGAVTAYLYGFPFFQSDWLNTNNLAQRWSEDRDRVLNELDGMFLLLVVTENDFFLVNDRISPLTWYWVRRGDFCYASNSLQHLLAKSQTPLDFDYESFRHLIHTCADHFDRSVVKGVSKLLKGHYISRGLQPVHYFWLPDHVIEGSTPDDYFDHLRVFIRETMAHKKVAVLSSNGFDSRMACVLLSQCLDHFDVFTIRSDVYSEHHRLREFLDHLPRQNFGFRVFGHSMVPSSPHYTARRLWTQRSLYLDCVDDLTINKQHMLFADVFATLIDEGYEVLVNGCHGGDVRTVVPIQVVFQRPAGLEAMGTPRTRELFAVSDNELTQQYLEHHPDPQILEKRREQLSDGQMSCFAPLLLNHGLVQVPLPICSARALQLYRGIDRTKIPGRGGVNFYREFIAQQVPNAPPIPYDTGIGLSVPGETKGWIQCSIDLDFAHQAMSQSGLFDESFLVLMRDELGKQHPPYTGQSSYLNLWAWFTTITDQRPLFEESLQPLQRSDPYLHPAGPVRTIRIILRRAFDQSRLWVALALGVKDHRHVLNRWRKAGSIAAKRGVYVICSTAYSITRRLFGLPPWEQMKARLRK